MRTSPTVLDRICKKMLRVILSCLPNATRGAIYSVGPIPHMRVVRIASGNRQGREDEIAWDVENDSDYSPPGKIWEEYCDRTGGLSEAISWCVGRQSSWTSDDPEGTPLSLSKQFDGEAGENSCHLEPVLLMKSDVWDELAFPVLYSRNSYAQPILQHSRYITVAVIKIHFLPGTIQRGDRSTRVIKELSEALGAEMLSLHAREVALEKEAKLLEERQEICNIIAHDFRNILARIRFAYRAVNNEISYLRHSWERMIQQELPQLPAREIILERLDELLDSLAARCDYSDDGGEISRLNRYHEQLAESCLLPEQNEIWLREKIRPLWRAICSKLSVEATVTAEVEKLLARLRDSFYVGLNHEIIDQIDRLPGELRRKWVELAYQEINGGNGTRGAVIDQYIAFLSSNDLGIPRQTHSKKNLTYLKGLIELIPEIEAKLNNGLAALKQGA